MKLLYSLMVCFALVLPVKAEVIKEFHHEDFKVLFHDTDCSWHPIARFAEYVSNKGEKIQGCWLLRGPFVHLKFVDGDIMRVPFEALKDPVKI